MQTSISLQPHIEVGNDFTSAKCQLPAVCLNHCPRIDDLHLVEAQEMMT